MGPPQTEAPNYKVGSPPLSWQPLPFLSLSFSHSHSLSLSLSFFLSPGLWCRGFLPYTARTCAPDGCGGQWTICRQGKRSRGTDVLLPARVFRVLGSSPVFHNLGATSGGIPFGKESRPNRTFKSLVGCASLEVPPGLYEWKQRKRSR